MLAPVQGCVLLYVGLVHANQLAACSFFCGSEIQHSCQQLAHLSQTMGCWQDFLDPLEAERWLACADPKMGVLREIFSCT